MISKLLLLLCNAGLANAAAAQSTPTSNQPLWELGLGAGLLRLPHYRGADQQHTWLLPVPYVVYRGEIFKADREGARAVLLDHDRVEIDLSAAASAPSRSRDNLARQGMANLAPTLELGPNLNWTMQRGPGWKLDLRLPLRAAATLSGSPRVLGWVATPNLNLDLRNAEGWNIGVKAGPVFGSRGLNGYFYDVPLANATASRPAYQAPGGFAGWNLTAGVSQRSGARWLGAFVKFDALGGAVFANSPLVRQRQQWSAGVAVSWVMFESERRAGSAR